MERKTLERIYRELGEILEERESYERMKKLLGTPVMKKEELDILVNYLSKKRRKNENIGSH